MSGSAAVRPRREASNGRPGRIAKTTANLFIHLLIIMKWAGAAGARLGEHLPAAVCIPSLALYPYPRCDVTAERGLEMSRFFDKELM